MSLAKITLYGNVGQDPESRFTAEGIQMTNFSIAVSDKKGKWTDWYRVTAWRKQGELVQEYVKKGDAVVVIGDLHLNAFTGKDGKDRVSLEVAMSDIQFGGKKNGGSEGGDAPRQGRPKPAKPTQDEDDDWFNA
jgi:single-strand DNA-binding protein